MALAVIVACAGLGIEGRFTGLSALRIKETDRLSALKTELYKLGITLDVLSGGSAILHAGEMKHTKDDLIETYGDHRMAMAFAPLTVKYGQMNILNPGVTAKSYPQFWKHAEETGFEICPMSSPA